MAEQWEHCGRNKVRCPAVLGQEVRTSTVKMFADEDNSGSALLRFGQDSAGNMVRTELVGVIYGVVYEEEQPCKVVTFMPTDRIAKYIKETIGAENSMAVPEKHNKEWPYEMLGNNLPIFDLHLNGIDIKVPQQSPLLIICHSVFNIISWQPPKEK